MEDKKEKVLTNWSQIEDANKLINTVELKGKKYAEVKERVIAFRRVHPTGTILTKNDFTDNYVLFDAEVLDADGKVLATGHSREYLKNEFALEKAETSAIGRALGFCGFGITTAIASAEDIENMDREKVFDEPVPTELAQKLKSLMSKQEYADFLNCVHVVDIEKVPSYLLSAMLRYVEEKHNTGR